VQQLGQTILKTIDPDDFSSPDEVAGAVVNNATVYNIFMFAGERLVKSR
jgi:hypothetical protein